MSRSVARPVVFDKDLPQPDLPPKVCALLNRFAPFFQAWLQQLIIALFGAASDKHFLIRLNNQCDFSDAVAQCASYYHTEGPGRTPTYTVDQLFRAEIVRAYYEACGDEELSLILQSNIVARVFVGLPFFAPVPSDTKLRDFHVWLCDNHPDLLFTTVLDFLERVDPEDPRETLHVVDTFAMESPAAAHAPAVVLMRVTAMLMEAWQQHAPVARRDIFPAEIDLKRLKTNRESRGKEKGLRQLQHAVRQAQQVVAAVTPHLERVSEELRTVIQEYIRQLEKVIADETTTNEAGEVVKRTKKGTYRQCSAYDPEATFRKHGDDPARFGVNVSLLATQTRIRAVTVLTGAAPDAEGLTPLMRFMRRHGLTFPKYLEGDKAFGHGAPRFEVHTLTDGETTLVANIPSPGGKDPDRYGPEDFLVLHDADGNLESCTCPNGQTSTRHYASGSGEGRHFRFTGTQCNGCELWEQCRGSNSKKHAHRQVFVSDYHRFLREANVFNASAEGQAMLGKRWFIEPTVAFVVRYNGCRRARRTGLKAAEFQVLQACAIRNVQMYFERQYKRTQEARRAHLSPEALAVQEGQVALSAA